jgi:hypothetical protein
MIGIHSIDLPVQLSAKGLATMPDFAPEDRFCFVVGSETYNCPFYVAAFLSPKIRQLGLIDKTQRDFVISTADPDRQFERFLLLGEGVAIPVDQSVLGFFGSVGAELGNDELLKFVWEACGDELNIDPCISRLSLLREMLDGRSVEMDFLASHYSEISSKDLDGLDVETHGEVLSRRSLKPSSEDNLFDSIVSRCFHSLEALGLLEYV